MASQTHCGVPSTWVGFPYLLNVEFGCFLSVYWYWLSLTRKEGLCFFPGGQRRGLPASSLTAYWTAALGALGPPSALVKTFGSRPECLQGCLLKSPRPLDSCSGLWAWRVLKVGYRSEAVRNSLFFYYQEQWHFKRSQQLRHLSLFCY